MSIHDATKQIGDCRLSCRREGEARQTKSLVDLDPEGYIGEAALWRRIDALDP